MSVFKSVDSRSKQYFNTVTDEEMQVDFALNKELRDKKQGVEHYRTK